MQAESGVGRSPWCSADSLPKGLCARRDVQKKAAFEAENLKPSANIEVKKAAAERGLAPGQITAEESLTGGRSLPHAMDTGDGEEGADTQLP